MREIYASCLAPDCVYTDPLTKAKGWDELAAYMTAFHDQIPGGHFVTQQFFAHHQRSVARWTMAGRDGEPSAKASATLSMMHDTGWSA